MFTLPSVSAGHNRPLSASPGILSAAIRLLTETTAPGTWLITPALPVVIRNGPLTHFTTTPSIHLTLGYIASRAISNIDAPRRPPGAAPFFPLSGAVPSPRSVLRRLSTILSFRPATRPSSLAALTSRS